MSVIPSCLVGTVHMDTLCTRQSEVSVYVSWVWVQVSTVSCHSF